MSWQQCLRMMAPSLKVGLAHLVGSLVGQAWSTFAKPWLATVAQRTRSGVEFSKLKISWIEANQQNPWKFCPTEIFCLTVVGKVDIIIIIIIAHIHTYHMDCNPAVYKQHWHQHYPNCHRTLCPKDSHSKVPLFPPAYCPHRPDEHRQLCNCQFLFLWANRNNKMRSSDCYQYAMK